MELKKIAELVDEKFGKYGGEDDLATTQPRKHIDAYLKREAGWTYQRIAESLGISAQGAMRRVRAGQKLVDTYILG